MAYNVDTVMRPIIACKIAIISILDMACDINAVISQWIFSAISIDVTCDIDTVI